MKTVGYILGTQQKSRGAQVTDFNPNYYSSWTYAQAWKTVGYYNRLKKNVDITTNSIHLRMI